MSKEDMFFKKDELMLDRKYRDKPVPEEAVNTGHKFANDKIFALGLLRFLVNDEGVVTFVYESDENPSVDDE